MLTNNPVLTEPTTGHPTAVVIAPPPSRSLDRFWTPAFSRRLDVEVEAETSPGPVQYSAFAGIGRDPTSGGRPHMWRYQALAIADKLSIAAPHFLVRKEMGAMVVPGASSLGGQNPIHERTNIESPRAGSLGERATVYADPMYAPQYAKIM